MLIQKRVRPTFARSILMVIAILAMFSMWFYAGSVLATYQTKEARRTGRPMGHVSDMFGPWVGACALLVEHRDPYGIEVTQAIQRNTYGRPLDLANPSDPKDQQRLVYPVPMLILVAPQAYLSFDTVRSITNVLLFLMTIASVPLWMRALNIRATRWATALATILMLGSWPVVQGLHLQQPTLAISFVTAAACASAASGHLRSAGVLLAISIAKPQVAAPIIGWFIIWTAVNWRERRTMLLSFAETSAVLFGASEVLQPGWILKWWTNVRAAKAYMEADIVLSTALGKYAGLAITVVAVVAIVAVFLRRGRDPKYFPLCVSLASVGGLLVTPNWLSYNQFVLLPAILWVCFTLGESKQPRLASRLIYAIAAAVLAWAPVTAIVLTFMSLFGSRQSAEQLWQVPLIAVLYTPAAVTAAVAVHASHYDKARVNAGQETTCLPS